MEKELEIALRYGIDCLMERSKKRPTQVYFYDNNNEMTAYTAAEILTKYLMREGEKKA